MRFLQALRVVGKFFPFLGLAFNRIAFRKIHCGLSVEFPVSGVFQFGTGLRIGASTRIYLGAAGRLDIGRNVNLGRDVHLQTDVGFIRVGNGTSIQDHCRIYGNVEVGSGCLFAPNVYVSSGAHVFDRQPALPIAMQEQLFGGEDMPIEIGDDCWIGVNAVLMPGVIVGKGSIIGAGSIVTKDVPPYSVAAGVPAKILRQRLKFDPPQEIDAACNADWPYFYSGFSCEEVADKNRCGLMCCGQFKLSLKAEGSTRLILDIEPVATGSELVFGNQSVVLENSRKQVECSLESFREGGALEIYASAPCRLYKASLR